MGRLGPSLIETSINSPAISTRATCQRMSGPCSVRWFNRFTRYDPTSLADPPSRPRRVRHEGQSRRGAGFRGLLNYLLAEHKQARIISSNMLGLHPAHCRMCSVLCGNVDRTANAQCSIFPRMPYNQDVPDETWKRIVTRFMQGCSCPMTALGWSLSTRPARPYCHVPHRRVRGALVWEVRGFEGHPSHPQTRKRVWPNPHADASI